MKKMLRMCTIALMLGTCFISSCSQGTPDSDNKGDNPNDDPNKDPNGDNPKPTPDPVIVKSLKITSLPTKTEYRVNETLSFEGLEVKLFTTTDDVVDEGVIYTNFHTSVEEGYTFKEEDITSLTKSFEVTVVSNEENIKSTTFELTVLEEEKPEVVITATLHDFMTRIVGGESYTITTPSAKGTFLKNAMYWEVLKNGEEISSSYGYAHRDSDSTTILYTKNEEVEDSYTLIHNFGSTFSGLNDYTLYEALKDGYNFQAFFHATAINSYNLKKYKNVRPTSGTHEYVMKPESKATYDPAWDVQDDIVNYYTKYVTQFIRLASNDAEFPISDFGAYNIYPKLTVVATLVSDDEMDVVVTTNASDVHWPLEYTIKIEPEASISFVEGFLNGTDEGSIGEDTKDPDTEVEGGTGEAQ